MHFETEDGHALCGILSSVDKGNGAAAIICHGFRSSKDGASSPRLQRILNKGGVSTLRFDFFGHGESGGRFEDITISEAVKNTLSAIRFLNGKGYGRIGLVGSSFGGISSIMTASKSKDLRVLVLRAPVSNYEEKELAKRGKDGLKKWKETGYVEYAEEGRKWKLKYSFFEDFKNNNGYEAGKNIKIPTLIIHGDKDEVVSVEQSVKLSKMITNSRLEIIKGADHNFSNEADFKKTLELAADFILENL